MRNSELEHWQAELVGKSPEQVLAWAYARFSPERVGFATSLGAEDQVVLDLLVRATPCPVVFTLDTGRLFSETHDTIDRTCERYGVSMRVLSPDAREIEAMVAQHGINLFRASRELRQRCCQVRKVNVLRRALAPLELWITGLRREQAVTRNDMAIIEWDEAFGLWKLNPLLDWSSDQVWAHIRNHRVPYSVLHDRGYPSIGCAPCTRAVAPGEDARAGRWWWEAPEHKECGLHWQDGKPVRIKRGPHGTPV